MNKVIYKLKDSDYIFRYKGLSFYFSSKLYLNKFVNNVQNFIETENLKFENRFKIKITLEIYLMISYYKKIEKRGFRIYDEIGKRELSENLGFGINLLMC